MKGDTITNHESFGQAVFCRTNSTPPRNFYGSSIKCSSYITLYISESELVRGDLNYDRFHAGREIISVRFSPNQFAELLTNMNMGGGVPCTIERTVGDIKRREDPPYISKKEQHSEEFKEKMKKIASGFVQDIKSIEELSKGLSKKKQKELMSKVSNMHSFFNSSASFADKMFGKQMDKTVTECKAEVESFVETKIRTVGLEAIKGSTPQLIENL